MIQHVNGWTYFEMQMQRRAVQQYLKYVLSPLCVCSGTRAQEAFSLFPFIHLFSWIMMKIIIMATTMTSLDRIGHGSLFFQLLPIDRENKSWALHSSRIVENGNSISGRETLASRNYFIFETSSRRPVGMRSIVGYLLLLSSRESRLELELPLRDFSRFFFMLGGHFRASVELLDSEWAGTERESFLSNARHVYCTLHSTFAKQMQASFQWLFLRTEKRKLPV